MKVCKYCGEPIGEECSGIQAYRADPFRLEIHGETVMKWLCPGTYQMLCWEI